jgi:hypothetical protein
MPTFLPARLVSLPYRMALRWGAGLCAMAAGAAWAADSPFASAAKDAWHQETAALSTPPEVTSAVLPSVAEAAPAPQTLPLGHAAVNFNQTQHVEITQWLVPPSSRAWGRFGLSLGLSGPGPATAAATLVNNSIPPSSLDWGMRWRTPLDGGRHLDIAAWARTPQWSQPQDAMGLIWQSQQPTFGTRVEVQWASSRTRGLVPEFGAIGVQLQGGSRLVLRARKGGPMLYYRAKF